ncbi:fibroblast growth factor receptor homolog 1-like [Hoplias malabaricus]|uniref:fibroblast growth factor receptor homolog 1-like n=1 Tax=Hoplias malabaricus TaxID=27720 RepID=UPI0034633DDE
MEPSSNLSCEPSDKNNILFYIIIIASAFIIIVIIAMALMWLKTYRKLMRTIRTLQCSKLQSTEHVSSPDAEADSLEQRTTSVKVLTVKLEQTNPSSSVLARSKTTPASRSLSRREQMDCQFNKADLSLQQLIKTGPEGVFYKANMIHSTINGHSTFTCKIFKKGSSRRQMEREVSVMQKLGTHKNLLQLLDWDITGTPCMLVMEYVAHGTLHSFLQVNQERLSNDKDLQQLFTITAYHIAHAMRHLSSRMILHCDLALRNILVNSFPREVKIAEFGLAREMTRRWSRHSSCKKECKERIPSRWYPPEYFKNDVYGFKGDVWAFGIVIWEMQTFGALPYPNLNTSEEVARYVCAGHRNAEPDQCRPEMLQMMKDCWLEPYSLRPSFMDIVRVIENILENDHDYVAMDPNSQMNVQIYCNDD